MTTHISTNTWKRGLENKLLNTYINSSPCSCEHQHNGGLICLRGGYCTKEKNQYL
mgnify:CR=1 FL=1